MEGQGQGWGWRVRVRAGVRGSRLGLGFGFEVAGLVAHVEVERVPHMEARQDRASPTRPPLVGGGRRDAHLARDARHLVRGRVRVRVRVRGRGRGRGRGRVGLGLRLG